VADYEARIVALQAQVATANVELARLVALVDAMLAVDDAANAQLHTLAGH